MWRNLANPVSSCSSECSHFRRREETVFFTTNFFLTTDVKKQLVLTKHLARGCLHFLDRKKCRYVLVVGDVLFDNVLNGCLHFHDLKSYMVFNGFNLISYKMKPD